MRRRTEAIDTEPFGLFRHPQRSVSDQSYLITLITQLAGVDKNDRAFETGTGSEYHAAILSRLAAQVISVKVVKPLADSAARRLEKMGYTNIEVRHADGLRGPFDAIIIKEAVPKIPATLINQLKPSGRLITPVGFPD